MSDKMFDTFKNKQMDNIKKVEFSIQKQVGLTKAGDRYKIESKRDGESNGRHGVKKQVVLVRAKKEKTTENFQAKSNSSLLYLSGSVSKKKIIDISISTIMLLTNCQGLPSEQAHGKRKQKNWCSDIAYAQNIFQC